MRESTFDGYRVTRTDVGTTYHDVPIFAECARGDLEFSADWVAQAVVTGKRAEQEGYLPPLHVRHHEPGTEMNDSVKAAGVFRITRAAPMTFKGTRVLAIFADLIITDADLAEDVARMRFPYRSVEIFNPDGVPEINGLALLDHEAPYLQLPMLFAGEVDDQRDPRKVAAERAAQTAAGAIPDTGAALVAGATSFSLDYSRKDTSPLLGSKRTGQQAALLFRFKDHDMTEHDKDAEYLSDEEKDGENMEGATLDVGAVCSAIESGEISVAEMDMILAAIAAAQSSGEGEEEGALEAAPAPTPGQEVMKNRPAGDAVSMARLQGEVDALRAKDAARDKRDAREVAVDEAMTRLEGKPLGADLRERLVNFHKTVDGNAAAFKEYVETMARTVGDLPADSSGANFAAQPNTPAVAMEYQSLGAAAVEAASGFAREYEQMGSRMRASVDAYVRINMRQLGYEVEKEAAQ
jgi:hypothetical protein